MESAEGSVAVANTRFLRHLAVVVMPVTNAAQRSCVRHARRDNGAMLLPALIVAGVITVPIPRVPPHAAIHVCMPMRTAGVKPQWFAGVGKAKFGCVRSYALPRGSFRTSLRPPTAPSKRPALQAAERADVFFEPHAEDTRWTEP